MACGLGDAGGDQIFSAGEKHRHEAAHHQVVEFLLGIAQPSGRLQRGDDGKVIADLGIVKNALAGLDVAVVERHQRMRRQVLHLTAGEHFKGLLDHRHIVFGQGARIGTRVGQCFVAFVQALRDRQRGLGRKAELAVGFALQGSQIKQEAGSLRGRL